MCHEFNVARAGWCTRRTFSTPPIRASSQEVLSAPPLHHEKMQVRRIKLGMQSKACVHIYQSHLTDT